MPVTAYARRILLHIEPRYMICQAAKVTEKYRILGVFWIIILYIYPMHMVCVCVWMRFLFSSRRAICAALSSCAPGERIQKKLLHVFQLFNQLQIKRWCRQDNVQKRIEAEDEDGISKQKWMEASIGELGARGQPGRMKNTLCLFFSSLSSVLTIVNQMTMIMFERKCVVVFVCVRVLYKVHIHQTKME